MNGGRHAKPVGNLSGRRVRKFSPWVAGGFSGTENILDTKKEELWTGESSSRSWGWGRRRRSPLAPAWPWDRLRIRPANLPCTTGRTGPWSLWVRSDTARALHGYVVQALVPAGSFGQYLIVNPDDRSLRSLAKSGDIVTVQGMLTGGSLLLLVQTIDGKHLSLRRWQP